MRKLLVDLVIMLVLLSLASGCVSQPADESPNTGLSSVEVPDNQTPDMAAEDLLPTEENTFVPDENDIIVNPGSAWELPGVLTLPAGEGPFPVAVISAYAHAASAAEYLATQGIASIRYDHRGYTYHELTVDVNLTANEDVIEDVLYAVTLAKTIKQIDPDQIYVAAHSLAGFFIPKIDEADRNDAIAGYVSMAAPALPYVESLKAQAGIIMDMDSVSEEMGLVARGLLRMHEEMANLTEEDRGSKSPKIAGRYPTYWLDLANYDPAEAAQNIEEPILFLQGGYDAVVLAENLDMWKNATQSNAQAVYKFYPELEHSFSKAEKLGGQPIKLEMEEEVLIDIANFIKGQQNL